ncbi:hypothetical protein CALCODRAFT_86911 [Calocera cornea HHB12733]|uniref:F-box domain-containing protein n=1 Tax=Calocera cornea HHB12733 TaxID=1353952 RepID=A0A165DCW8_9BASI|nr:hypothetical protein CALCODRAFT_86911 [Calocera cornea HHB12733]
MSSPTSTDLTLSHSTPIQADNGPPVVFTTDDMCDDDQLDNRTRSNAAQNAHLPIARLPDGILQAIFEIEAQPLQYIYVSSATSDRLPFQVRISHVCRRWRRLALQTARLWSTFVLNHQIPLELVTEVIRKRAKGAALNVNIPDSHSFSEIPWSVCNTFDHAVEVFPSLVQFVEQHLHRFKCFSIGVCKHSLSHLLRNQRTIAGALTALRFTLVSCYSPATSVPPESGYQLHAPSLHAIEVDHVPLPSFTPGTRLPNVVVAKRYAHLLDFTPAQVLQEFRDLSHVKTLAYIFGLWGTDVTSWLDQTIALPQLCTLQIGCFSPNPRSLAQVFQRLSLPSLHRLDLRLLSQAHEEEPLFSALEYVPMISELSLNLAGYTSPLLLRRLVHNTDGGQPILLPRLQILELYNEFEQYQNHDIFEALEAMAILRCNPTPNWVPLKKLHIAPPLPRDTVETLTQFGLLVGDLGIRKFIELEM